MSPILIGVRIKYFNEDKFCSTRFKNVTINNKVAATQTNCITPYKFL